MNGRVYAQKGDAFGWMKAVNGRVPNGCGEISLTPNVCESGVFDVDGTSMYALLNAMIEQGYYILIGNVRISCQTVRPSASPFSPVV